MYREFFYSVSYANITSQKYNIDELIRRAALCKNTKLNILAARHLLSQEKAQSITVPGYFYNAHRTTKLNIHKEYAQTLSLLWWEKVAHRTQILFYIKIKCGVTDEFVYYT